MSGDRVLIYGATGYTGRLIVTEAVKRGLPLVLGGRSAAVQALGKSLGLPSRVFDVDSDGTTAALEGCRLVLNCAGPFSRTALPLVEACVRSGVHYLDITGEVGVFASLAERDLDARHAGIMLLPGVGFDVVPTDCLAAHLHARLPTASTLVLAFRIEGRASRGTFTSMLENVHQVGLARRDGTLVPIHAGDRTRVVDFGEGPVTGLQIAWGDLVTAYRSTGIANIEIYVVPSTVWRTILRACASWRGPLSVPFVQRTLRALIRALPNGPTARARRLGHSVVWGEAADAEGRTATSRLRAPEAYTLTAITAVAAAALVLRGVHRPGFQTPALVFGSDFILGVDGVSREDL